MDEAIAQLTVCIAGIEHLAEAEGAATPVAVEMLRAAQGRLGVVITNLERRSPHLAHSAIASRVNDVGDRLPEINP